MLAASQPRPVADAIGSEMVQRRLLFLITGLIHGGAETQLLRLATRLRARGWKVQVVTMIPPETFATEFEGAEIPVESLHMPRGTPDPRALLRLAGLLRSFRPDVVHSHMVHANLLARLARLFYHVPVLVSTAHNIQEGGRWREVAIRITDPLCDLTTSVSHAAVDRYRRLALAPGHKLRHVPNGIDTARFRPDPAVRARLRRDMGVEECFVWLAIGRLSAAKDYPTLFQAFSRLLRGHPDAVLLVVGDGPLRAEHEASVVTLGSEGKVRFLGIRNDIPELMNAADAYVMSSAWEGLPMVLLEASATGLPIVATDVGGNREIVMHGRTGFLVPPHEPAELSAAMERLIGSPEPERRRLGREGRRSIETKYALERVVDTWEELYLKLLRRDPGRSGRVASFYRGRAECRLPFARGE